MNDLLNFVSVTSSILFGIGIIYIGLDFSFGRLKVLHSKMEWNGLQIKDFVFLLVATIVLFVFFDFVKPY